MICSQCGSTNDPDCRFCTDCGAPLAAACPQCSATSRPGSRFCGGCGAALGDAPPQQPEASSGGAQRRVVTVLFADLVGFTTISQHRDSEDVRDLLTRYFDTARAAVERHGGIVEKFIGDAVMAVWGTDVAHEDDAERAVRAALEVVDGVAALGTQVGVDLQARAGVLTGEATVTVGATGQGMVAGDLVNTASRLQSAAEPGAVLVGEATYRAACDAVGFEPRGETTVKGRDEPVGVWCALRVVGQRGGSGRPGRPEPPFAGRAEELRLVKELFHVTERERRARLVSITGIGGIGKSRLVWEFKKYVDGLSDDVFWHQGRCPAYGEGVTFWALGEMVRMRGGIAETDKPPQARAKLAAMVAEYVRDVDERRWVETRLAHLLGLEDAAVGNREELFAAWRALFERVAERGMTTMVFEDLHWADPGLLDFIDSILEWSRNSAIMVVTLARPELLDRRPSWGAGQRNFTALHLEPLREEPMTELVTGFVSGLAATDTARIIARAEGVPLYAVETIRMLVDSGVLIADGTKYRVVGDIGTLQVPSSLHALIAARLDVLAADDRELLRDASVLGTSFLLESVATVRDEPAEVVEPRLRDLVRKEFLTQETDPRSPERGQYAFLQGLIREVAYGTLSKADRRRKHLAVAEHFESMGDDEVTGIVASHYVEALRATPEGPEASELARIVRERVMRAADRALSLGSPDQALDYVEQALKLTPEHARGPLLELAGDAAARAGRHADALAHLDAATTLYTGAGDHTSLARVAARAFDPLAMLERRSEGLQRLQAAQATLPESADDRTRAQLFLRLADATQLGEDAALAVRYADTALEAAERSESLDLLAEALSVKGIGLFSVGRHREALVVGRGAVDIASEHGSHRSRAIALLHLGVQLAEISPHVAYATSQEAVAACRRAGVRALEHVALANTIESALDAGEFDVAEQLLDDLIPRAEEVLRQTGDVFLRTGLQFNVAMLAAYRGEADAAMQQLADLTPRMQSPGRVLQERTWHLRASCVVRLLCGDPVSAYADGMQAAALEPTGMNAANALAGCAHAAAWLRDADRLKETAVGMRLLLGPWMKRHARAADAAISALTGSPAEAAAAYTRILTEWEEEDLPLDHAWCVVDALAVLPRDLVPDEHVTRAGGTLTRLGAAPLLTRLGATTPA